MMRWYLKTIVPQWQMLHYWYCLKATIFILIIARSSSHTWTLVPSESLRSRCTASTSRCSSSVKRPHTLHYYQSRQEGEVVGWVGRWRLHLSAAGQFFGSLSWSKWEAWSPSFPVFLCWHLEVYNHRMRVQELIWHKTNMSGDRDSSRAEELIRGRTSVFISYSAFCHGELPMHPSI